MKSAILITYDEEDILNEATELCHSAGYEVKHVIKQRYLKRRKYGISEAIIERLEELAEKIKPDVIVYDENMKPSQNYNLASKLHRNILDREALILEIFERRASSYESKLQVKLAQMRYEMSRAKEKVRLAKLGEQPGFMGIGKFEVDVYYNDIKHRMISVRSKLKKAGKQRELHRESRRRQGFKIVSLAGYTSAGKTSLFNSLTGEVLEQNSELFTTLSTTTRKFTINRESFLISDTIGFISKLPAYMIEAFKSTLEELLYTNLILLVIDASDTFFELKKKFQSCIKTLNELEVDRDKIIYVLNKSDLLDKSEISEKVEYLGLEENKKWVSISAKKRRNFNQLEKLITDIISEPEMTKNSSKEELEKIYGN